MTINVDNLVRRLAAILTDIEGMESVDLDPLANSPLPEGARLARMLRRASCCVGSSAAATLASAISGFYGTTTEKTTFVPALPGL